MLVVLLGTVLVAAAYYYGRMAEEVQRLSFDVAARNFGVVAAAVHAQGVVQHSRGITRGDGLLLSRLPGMPADVLDDPEVRVFLNDRGWPVNTLSAAQANDGQLEVAECVSLWRAFFRDRSAVATDNTRRARSVGYEVLVINTNGEEHCRYRHLVDALSGQYFDYFPGSGALIVGSSRE